MKFKTLSVLAGSEACNARCPFCVSKMTPPNGIAMKEPEVNWRNFDVAMKFAKYSGVDTAMITGKGEPTLFPKQVSSYLSKLNEFGIPFLELQTNGIPISKRREKYDHFVKDWYKNGLTMVAISTVHYDAEKNRGIYLPHQEEYIDLPELIDYLHDEGLSVRLSCVGLDGYIDSAGELEKLISFAKENKVEQLTLRPVDKPGNTRNSGVYDWILKNHMKKSQVKEISSYLEEKGTKLFDLAHGGVVYDVDDQNVGLATCLTRDSNPENQRALIFYPDGHLRYEWEKKGAILL